MEMTTLTMQDEKQIKIMQRVFQGEVTGQVEISPSDVVAGYTSTVLFSYQRLNPLIQKLPFLATLALFARTNRNY
jgi:hypothetical protein